MSRFQLSRVVALAALAVGASVPAAAVAAAPASAATTTYTITDLGSLGGGSAEGFAINAVGQVTGASTLARTVQVPCEFPQPPNKKTCPVHPDHAFLWSKGTMTDLGTLGGLNSQGVAINDSGDVVGFSELKTGFNDGQFLSNSSNQKLTALSNVVGALGITDSGQITGECQLPAAAVFFACVISSNGTVTQLGDQVPPLGPDIACFDVVAVNTSGQALANCEAEGLGAPFQGHAVVVWNNGTPTVVGTPGANTGDDVAGTAMNNSGQVVGLTLLSDGGEGGGFLSSNGTITNLSFSPAAINDSGVIVGQQFVDNGGTVQNLNSLIPAGSGFQIFSATGISDIGQIVANATDIATGQPHALLLTPH